MRNHIFFSVALLFASYSFQATGQVTNIPIGTDLGQYPTPGLISLPLGYNQGANAGISLADQTTPKLNYRRSWSPQIPVTGITSLDLNAPDHIFVETKYVNGWGSTIQTNLRATAAGLDAINIFDQRSMSKSAEFLPFTAPKKTKFIYNPFADQQSYYNANYSAEEGASYSQTEIPDNQSTSNSKNCAPGKAYVGQDVGVTSTITYNSSTELRIITVSNGQPSLGNYYGQNEIKVNTTTDAESGVVKEYYNKDGQLLCKRVKKAVINNVIEWLSTYYIYNDLGKLIMIIPPNGYFENTNVFVTQNCYRYEYNVWGLLSKKYLPGFDNNTDEQYVYDRRQRLVLFQNPKLAAQGKYKFYFYDKRDRIVAEGLFSDLNSPQYWQTEIHEVGNTTVVAGSFMDYIIHEPPAVIPSITNCEILVRNYYDGNYTGTGTAFTSGNSFSTVHASHYRTDNGAVAPQWYKLPQGLLTRSETFVINGTNNNLGGDNVTVTQYYYDNEGKLIQTRTSTPWTSTANNNNTTTYQYNFTGKKILEVSSHTGPNWGVQNNSKPFTTLFTAYYYDKNNGDRLISVMQKLDGGNWRSIAGYLYDNFGKVRKESVGGVENRDYSYDLKGKLSAINKHYVEVGQSSSNMPTTFGEKLFYEYGFLMPRRDAKLSGIIWRGAGTAPMHSYGYHYDLAGRLSHAEFREYSSSPYISMYTQNGPVYAQGLNWNKQYKDYTASNMTYDDNGNLKFMNQVGVPAGFDHPVYIDVMAFSHSSGNRQTASVDAITYNYHLDEFVDRDCEIEYDPDTYEPPGGVAKDDPDYMTQYYELDPPPTATTQAACTDYYYDQNGNLIQDHNKGMTLTYNHMNQPVDVSVLNYSGFNNNQPSTIHNIYDGSGNLLRKTIIDNTFDPQLVQKYEYFGPFVYRNDSLIYILHQDGRTRYDAVNQNFLYDYFIKDHRGNVRTTITAEEYDGLDYVASHEIASAGLESSIFFNINHVRSANPLPGTGNAMSARLNGAVDSTRIGTAILLEVMPGDVLDLSADYYYEEDSLGSESANSSGMLSSLLGTLSGGFGGYTGNEAPSTTLLNGLLNTSNYSNTYDAIKNSQTNTALPKAYLNYQVFDQNMNLVSSQSGALQIGTTLGAWDELVLNDPLTIGQAGHVLVYVSNEQHHDVHFDKVSIKFYKGKVIQEQHYYPYGLCVNNGETQDEPNNFKYEGKLLQKEIGMQLYDYKARQYDPQIGRFWGVDPAGEFPSGYTGIGNDPANLIDPTGMRVRGANAASDADDLITSQMSNGTGNSKEKDRSLNLVDNSDIGNFVSEDAFREFNIDQGSGNIQQNDGNGNNGQSATDSKAGVVVSVIIFANNEGSAESKRNFGHTAVQVGDVVYGFYSAGDGYMNEPGVMKADTRSDFNMHFEGRKGKTFILKVSNAEAAKLEQNLQALVKEPGRYQLLKRQCTTVAIGAMNRAGIRFNLGKYNDDPWEKKQEEQGKRPITPNQLRNCLESDVNKNRIQRSYSY